MTSQPARLGLRPDDLSHEKLEPGRVRPWEDGMRTDGAAGTYEWWYADAHYDDGSSCVIVFYTKSMMASNLPLTPQITFNYNGADGTVIRKVLHFAAADFSAEKDHTDVRIGGNLFTGDLDKYTIHVAFDDVEADVVLTRTAPSWRLGNGYSYYGEHDENHMGWFPAVPAGHATLTISNNGRTRVLEGRGYHDHNWGNVPELEILHHWYWGRACVGPYALITYDMTAAEKYGYQHLPMFMLVKDGHVIADDPELVAVELSECVIDDTTGKPVHNTLVYTYADRYRITYRRENTIEAARMLDALKDPALRRAVESNGFNGAYLRFTGSVTVEDLSGGTAPASGTAIWELMYFGAPID